MNNIYNTGKQNIAMLLLFLLPVWSIAQVGETYRVEAEHFDDLGTYTIENKAGASNFKIIKAASGGGFSTATSAFGFPEGIYTVKVVYFDESDGTSTYKFGIDGDIIDSWEGNHGGSDQFVTKTLQGILILPGNSIMLLSNREAGENGRFDYVEFVLESANDGSSHIIETEDCELENFAIDNTLDGYTGSGYVVGNAENSSFSTNITIDSTSYFNVKIRYHNPGEGHLEMNIISGNDTIGAVLVPNSPFSFWNEQIVTLLLPEGDLFIKVEGSGLPYIDRLLLQRTNPESALPFVVNKLAPGSEQLFDSGFPIYWLGTENTFSYRLFIGTNAELTEDDVVCETSLTHFQTEPMPDGNYYWKVEAANPAGTSESEIKSFIFKAEPSTFYVATDGNNDNTGTFDKPFLTIIKALEVALPGDTIYIRGGEYRFARDIEIKLTGNVDKHINIFAWPGEQPVFNHQSNPARGIEIDGEYVHMKGINVTLAGDNGIYIEGHHNIIEMCHTYRNGDSGIQLSGGASHNTIINCDSYENYDPKNHGENADGFAAKFELGEGNQFIGCRAWLNSDDGWDFWQATPTIYLENCHAFRNGYNIWGDSSFDGDGNGIKFGGDYYAGPHKAFRCVTFLNRGKGFDQNHNMAGIEIINCTGYRNGGGNFRLGEKPNEGNHRLVNNLAFIGNNSLHSSNEEITNSWDLIDVDETDFASLDTTGVTAPRNEDGSLPEIMFLKLRKNSDAIDAGTILDFDFEDEAPDLGAYEGGYDAVPDNSSFLNDELTFACYPNPAKNILHVKANDPLTFSSKLKLCNLSGRTVLSRIISQSMVMLDVSEYKRGLYYLIIENENNVYRQKILIE
ncbi:MAG: T9SS type A sorting domain-containing protein [Prolixibacteraceae bacterium]|nr:T9SS type A sorting domain-containing protein [Prolixibacteraceae bacterium]